jgi:hypothetical protein
MTGPQPPTVTRAKTMQVTPAGADRYRFTARLTDSSENGNYPGGAITIHDFGLEGEAEGPDLTLVSLDVHAYSHPYADCPFVIPATQRLIGQPLMSGWRRAVIGEGAGTAGCTHVNTLLLGLAELSTMVYFLKINPSVPYAGETLADGRWTEAALQVSPRLAGVCHGLRPEGRALTAAREQIAQKAAGPG